MTMIELSIKEMYILVESLQDHPDYSKSGTMHQMDALFQEEIMLAEERGDPYDPMDTPVQRMIDDKLIDA